MLAAAAVPNSVTPPPPMQDEYWTSQRCHACTSFLVDGPRHREKQCVTCDKVINRDLNAALNLQVLRSTS